MKNYLDSIDREALRSRANQVLGYANDARDCAARWTDRGVLFVAFAATWMYLFWRIFFDDEE